MEQWYSPDPSPFTKDTFAFQFANLAWKVVHYIEVAVCTEHFFLWLLTLYCGSSK